MVELSSLTDEARVEAVRSSGLLDSKPEELFDQLARLAAQMLDTPSAFVTVIDADRQYFKSAISNDTPTVQAGSSVPLASSFCKFAVASKEPFLVEDARIHPLVQDTDVVQNGVVAYAGVPLEDPEGQAVGALCVVDSRPRQWSDKDIGNLRAIAKGAARLIAERQSGRARSAEVEDQAVAAQSIIEALQAHLRAADLYVALVSGEKAVNFDEESAARERLTKSLATLRQTFEQGSAEIESGDPELASAVRRYLDADRDRDDAARAFHGGAGELGALQSSIARHADAADALRLMAIDHGAIL